VLVSAWPAVAFIGSAEMLFWMIRSRAVPVQVHDSAPVPAGADELAAAFAPELAEGALPGVRVIKSRLSCGQPRAQQVREHLAGVLARQSANGHRDLEPVR
jgi:hypothetical protein